MTSPNCHQRNTQAVKVLLSELYATWITSDGGVLEVQKAIEEVLNLAEGQGRTNVRFADGSDSGYRHAPQSGQEGAEKIRQQQQRPTDVNPFHHMDPYSTPQSKLPNRSTSPPHSPSGPVRRRSTEESPRSPSPVQTPRFLGVDELDYPHRASPPGSLGSALSSSAVHTKPVVDPMAPVPHTSSSGSSSPPAAHSFGGPNSDAAITCATGPGEVFSLDASTNGSTNQPVRFVHSSGSFASMPPDNVRRATFDDIPLFYGNAEMKGVQQVMPEVEGAALKNFFAVKSFTLQRKTLPGSVLPIDTTKTVRKGQFGKLCQEVFKIPTWLKDLLFHRITINAGTPELTALTYGHISSYYYNVLGHLSANRRLFHLIRGNAEAEHLTLQDFKEMVRYLVDSHPGLEFLKQPEFQEYYCRTVAIRIIYALERQQSGRISWFDFDRSNLCEVMHELDEKDVNLVLQYFSYEHFYVLYCKFWELDTDRDQLVGFDDLCKYGQGSVTPSVIKRVVEGAGRPLSSGKAGKLNFEDFVYFCLSEEDKNCSPAVYYWFKVLDLDGDGILSGYELYRFYQENCQRFLDYSESPEGDLLYADMMCQMMDMVKFSCSKEGEFGLTLKDLRACSTPANFFNMVFNAAKFMLFEHRDPFAEHQQRVKLEKTDWDRFARAEYDRMASEAQ